jgi:hypothetical protein
MRKVLADQLNALREQEAADEALAIQHEREIAYLDKLQRDFTERRDDLMKAVASTFNAVAGDIDLIRAQKLSTIAELRGGGQVLANARPRQLPPVSEEASPE